MEYLFKMYTKLIKIGTKNFQLILTNGGFLEYLQLKSHRHRGSDGNMLEFRPINLRLSTL